MQQIHIDKSAGRAGGDQHFDEYDAMIAITLSAIALVNVAVMLPPYCQAIRRNDGGHIPWTVAAAYLNHAADIDSPLPYRLLLPQGVESVTDDQTWPLLIFLHGAGERGSDNTAQLTGLPTQLSLPHWRRKYPCFLLAPQCPQQSSWTQQLLKLERTIDNVSISHPVDRSRIYLTGLSMGGTATWQLGVRRPEFFAAIAPMCGVSDVGLAETLAGVPTWVFHGDADQIIPAG